MSLNCSQLITIIGTVKGGNANVTPTLKKGKKDDPGNYRPHSLTLIPGEVIQQFSLEPLPGT